MTVAYCPLWSTLPVSNVMADTFLGAFLASELKDLIKRRVSSGFTK